MTNRLPDDAKDALAIAPKIKELMDLVRDRLPEGTHFAIAIEVQAPTTREARVLVASTNRERMALRLAEWITSDIDPLEARKRKP